MVKMRWFKLGYLKKYWKKYKFLFLMSVLCVACEALCDLAQPRILSTLIDNGAAKGDLNYVLRVGLLMFGITGLGAVFALARNALSSYTSQNFGAELRLELFVHIQSLSVDNMDKFEGGSLVTRETSDVTQLQNFINGLMRMFFKAPVMCIGAIIMSASLDLKTLPIILPIIFLVVSIISISMRLAYPRFARVQEALDRLNTTMREYLVGIRLVKAFRRFKEEASRFSSANDELTDSTVRANRTLAIFAPFMALFVNLGIAIILIYGARWVNAGEMQVGQVMAFITYMILLLTNISMFSSVLNLFVRVRASNERIAEILNTPSEFSDGSDSLSNYIEPKITSDKHIEFIHVDFSYRGSTGHPALTDIYFGLKKGQTLGVIGSTGSGKSTLAALLMRFYEPSDGKIYVNGTPISDIPGRKWREHISIVPQTPTLFAGTIRENILWGREDAPEAQIEKSTRFAEAYDFIMRTPEGFDTYIGQNGVNLSGGQKQRISIARALIREPEILVLDDCTSALDLTTEAKVKRALRTLPMTCILITQRISTAMTCDYILVLENGKQAGFGTHSELLAACPEYRGIYHSQIGEGAV